MYLPKLLESVLHVYGKSALWQSKGVIHNLVQSKGFIHNLVQSKGVIHNLVQSKGVIHNCQHLPVHTKRTTSKTPHELVL